MTNSGPHPQDQVLDNTRLELSSTLRPLDEPRDLSSSSPDFDRVLRGARDALTSALTFAQTLEQVTRAISTRSRQPSGPTSQSHSTTLTSLERSILTLTTAATRLDRLVQQQQLSLEEQRFEFYQRQRSRRSSLVRRHIETNETLNFVPASHLLSTTETSPFLSNPSQPPQTTFLIQPFTRRFQNHHQPQQRSTSSATTTRTSSTTLYDFDFLQPVQPSQQRTSRLSNTNQIETTTTTTTRQMRLLDYPIVKLDRDGVEIPFNCSSQQQQTQQQQQRHPQGNQLESSRHEIESDSFETIGSNCSSENHVEKDFDKKDWVTSSSPWNRMLGSIQIKPQQQQQDQEGSLLKTNQTQQIEIENKERRKRYLISKFIEKCGR
ncbi:hypothetical protein OIO90_002730 [Microbotryomycetes sp. JL221]|nr:hypothetical protein OIO90_002730 [Microbotryomycetes sp. JL221]